MISVATRIHHFVRLLAVTALLLAVPFASNVHQVAAMPMEHEHMATVQNDCASVCARAATVPQQAIVQEDEQALPDPIPHDATPYYVQFFTSYALRNNRPLHLQDASLARPPDIVKLSANFRF